VARRTTRAGAAALLVVATIVLAASPPVVRWADDRLTIHAADVPLGTVLREVARATGVELHGAPIDRAVSADLDGVPLEDALVQLLGRDNFALTYRADGRVRAIEVLGAAAERRFWPPVSPPGDAPEDPAIPRDRAVMSRTVAVHGRAAKALGTERPMVGQLVIAAFREENRAARADIQRAALAAMARDPEVEATFARTLAPIEDDALAEILRRWNETGSEEFLAKLASQARSAELRAKAAAVRERLGAPPPPPGRRR
jgi:hypothetical protein